MLEYKPWRTIQPEISWTGDFFYIKQGDLTLTDHSYNGHDLIFGTPNGIITGRSIEEYIHFRVIQPDFLSVNCDHAVCMIGCGLDELTYELSRITRKTITVIDPANYERMVFLLDFALHQNPVPSTKKQARQFIERASAILNSPSIKHYPLRLQDAFNRYRSQLVGKFDTVVDIMGPLSSSPNIQGANIAHLEKLLLKPELRRQW